MDLIAKQIALEEESVNAGVAAYRERTARLEQKGIVTKTDYGKDLLRDSIETMINAIAEYKVEAKKNPSNRAVAVVYLDLVEDDVAAFITCRTILDGIGGQQSVQSVAMQIAGRLEDEVSFRSFEEQNGGLFAAVQRNLDAHPMGYQARVRTSTLKHAAKKFNIACHKWSKVDKLHVGVKLVGLFTEKLDLVKQEKAHRDVYHLCPTPALVEWINGYKEDSEVLWPQHMPMVSPPVPFTTPTDGGYLTKRLRVPLVKNFKANYQKELRTNEMPVVYNGVNALQATPWRINDSMLTLVTEIWDAGLEVKGFPSRHDTPLPPKPPGFDEDPELRKVWGAKAADVFRANLRSQGRRMTAAKVMFLADKFKAEAAIYFPVQLDFRGRMYTVPQYLNPQASDLSKALLMFAEGKPLGAGGVRWLAIHIANAFGFDKVSMDDRAAWTRQHSDRIERMVTEPLADLWWTEADKPFQFLAACIEWVGYLVDGGEMYVSRLPIMVDGSCNGLQHFAAMLRDEVSGAHVNLVPSEKPSDIYAAVAAEVMAELQAEAAKGVKYAAEWHGYKLGRKDCKRPVMVLPYGGTRDSVREYLQAAVSERAEAGQRHPFPDDKELGKAVAWLATVVWNVMGRVIVGPRVAMDWLRDSSKVVSKAKNPIYWTTPSGFLVFQAYPKEKANRVKTKVGDEIVYFTIHEDIDQLDTRKQGTAISPNFVHSLDASALVLTIVECVKRGIPNFAAIHDSYGTLAADMPVLTTTLREQFVQMYEANDVLAQFAAGIAGSTAEGDELPAPPAKAALDLRGVLASDFFFS